MASSYALPLTAAGDMARNHHGHSHSFSGSQLSSASTNNSFSSTNGHVRKAASNGSLLYTHDETSRENSPYPSPQHEHDHAHAFQTNIDAAHTNGHVHAHSHDHAHSHSHDHAHGHSHSHSHSHSGSPMKGRARGESDLGRSGLSSSAYTPGLSDIPAASASWFSLPEALTALLIPLPYLLASAAYSSNGGAVFQDAFPPLSAYAKLQEEVLTSTSDLPSKQPGKPSGLVEACQLASGTLLLVGILAKIRAPERVLDRRKDGNTPRQARIALDAPTLQSVAIRTMSVGFPFYAAMKLGGMRTGLVLLAAVAANLTCFDSAPKLSPSQWLNQAMKRKLTMAAILLSILFDVAGFTIHTSISDLFLGYVALAISVVLVHPPLPTSSGRSSSQTTTWTASPLTSSKGDVNLTLIAGGALSLVTVFTSVAQSKSLFMPKSVFFSTLSIATATAANCFAQPATLRNTTKAGLALGCLVTASSAFLFSPSLWPGTICNGGLSALAFAGVMFDTSSPLSSGPDHTHDHANNVNTRHDHHADGEYSPFTRLVLSKCEPGSLIHSIVIEKDSRRIAYFTWYAAILAAKNLGFTDCQ